MRLLARLVLWLLAILFLVAAFGGFIAGDTVMAGVTVAIGVFFAMVARMLKKSGNWRDDPATERQKQFAAELGIAYPKRITKGELSDLISRETDG